MSSERRIFYPRPHEAQERRLRLRHGLSEPLARALAGIVYGGGVNG